MMGYQKNKYYTYEEMRDLLQSWQKAYPDLMKVESIGNTYEGREIFAVTVTAGGNHLEKPGILVNGNLHSKELIGSAAVLYAMEYFLRSYGKDEEITSILQDKTLYFIPRINMDGAEDCLTSPYTFRGSKRPFHQEEDGIYPKDVNGDGEILKMRVPSETGQWKCDSEDPRIMVHRTPEDTEGSFYDIFSEGMVKGDLDAPLKDARDPYDLDPNRQFPFDWSKDTIGYMLRECSGNYPLYECEVRHLADFIFAHENLNTVVDEHSYCGAYISPMEFCQEHPAPARDIRIFSAEGQKAYERTGYLTKQVFPKGCFGVAKGSYTTWLYYERGIAAWCNENWNSRQLFEQVDAEHPIPYMVALTPPDEALRQERMLMQWNDAQPESYFSDWEPFFHPQLGMVEIGGWKEKWIKDNPPKEYIEQECEKALRFILQCIEASPQLAAGEVEVSFDGKEKYIQIPVKNRGSFPVSGTYQAEELGFSAGLSAVATLDGVCCEAEHVPENIAGGETAVLRFPFPKDAEGTYKIAIKSARAGYILREGRL